VNPSLRGDDAKQRKSRILGIDFFSGSLPDAVLEASRGGLCVAPSGPGLAGDLVKCSFYARAVTQADLVLPDSGLMCLWSNFFARKPIRRISGLAFLRAYLFDKDVSLADAFWVMPDQEQSEANRKWINKELGQFIQEDACYVAPTYAKTGVVEDLELLAQLREIRPKTIFIQLGGGVQERLGFYLRENLSFSSVILCTGAALAFLSGTQARIPNWADRFYMGWMVRCLVNPKLFVPRYLKAFTLIGLLAKNGSTLPEVVDSFSQN
jgi:N-acetylglucosaminyldiphosphoundecaprenol N-acetyl-beta-D-mannosaminyltransferase